MRRQRVFKRSDHPLESRLQPADQQSDPPGGRLKAELQQAEGRVLRPLLAVVVLLGTAAAHAATDPLQLTITATDGESRAVDTLAV